LAAPLADGFDVLRQNQDVLIVAAMTIPMFWFSRKVLKREIYRAKTLMSMIVSAAFGIANGLLLPLVAWYCTAPVSALLQAAGVPVLPATAWSGWPFAVLVLVSLLAYDFVEYWNHRFLHMKWLWPIHAIHHSDPDVNGFTTFRVHVLQVMFNIASFTLTLSWLNMPAEVSAVSGLIVTIVNAYVHMDVDWGHGPLRKVIASPQFHRWHHADTPELYGKNIANLFPFYDVMFGTYHVPGNCREPMGAVGVPENNVAKLMLYPFVEPLRMARREWVAHKAVRAARQADAAARATPAE
jgi:sterol desaturase/sphingolipid hydroxylase (fatty acid hydroxylase superfamily)